MKNGWKSLLCLVLALALLPAAMADTQFLIDSDRRQITESELWLWDRESLSFMFNEIFARHGYTFEPGGKFYNWFNSQPWYQRLEKVSKQTACDRTTQLEWQNYYTIKKVIADMEAAGHPYRKGPHSTLRSWLDLTPPSGSWSLTGFQYVSMRADQRLDVYSAPSASSWRGANGRAMVNTNGAVWAAGWENGWLQIFYELNNGGLRVGYVDGNRITGDVQFYTRLVFAYLPCQLNGTCRLTDDPLTQSSSIASLRQGETVTYLTTVTNQRGQVFDYVETTVSGRTARGYIPAGYIALPQDVLPNMDDFAG